MVFLWFSYGFPMVFLWFSTIFLWKVCHLCIGHKTRPKRPKTGQEERRKGQLSGAQIVNLGMYQWGDQNGHGLFFYVFFCLMEYGDDIHFLIWIIIYYIILHILYIYIIFYIYGCVFWGDKWHINVDIDIYCTYSTMGTSRNSLKAPSFAVDAMNSALQNAEKHIRKVGTAALGRHPLKVITSCDV